MMNTTPTPAIATNTFVRLFRVFIDSSFPLLLFTCEIFSRFPVILLMVNARERRDPLCVFLADGVGTKFARFTEFTPEFLTPDGIRQQYPFAHIIGRLD